MAVTFHRTEMAIMNQINNLKLYEKVRSPRVSVNHPTVLHQAEQNEKMQ